MALPKSDALVVFGVTGDLAHKQILPALYAMVKRGELTVPVVGVAFPKWSIERLHRRIIDSIEKQWVKVDQDVFITAVILNPSIKISAFASQVSSSCWTL